MTIDRDIRFTPGQIAVLQDVVRRRKRELGRSIARADGQAAAGVRIQRGTYEQHVEELNELARIGENLEVARKQIQHLIMAKLEGRNDE